MPIQVTYKIAHAAAMDAGNAHMRQHGRTSWNRADYDAAAEIMSTLLSCPSCGADLVDCGTHYACSRACGGSSHA